MKTWTTSARAALAASLLCAACAGEPSAPRLAADAPSRVMGSSGLETHFRFPIEIVQFVPCANGNVGEQVTLAGTLHLLTNVTASASGNFLVRMHLQPQGVSGRGLTTGARYQGTGVTQEVFTTAAAQTQSFVNSFRIIGQGRGNNLLIHETIHITVNANGAVTASRLQSRLACR